MSEARSLADARLWFALLLAVGMICWNLITRVVPVFGFGSAVSIGSDAWVRSTPLVVFLVVDAVALALLVSCLLAAKRSGAWRGFKTFGASRASWDVCSRDKGGEVGVGGAAGEMASLAERPPEKADVLAVFRQRHGLTDREIRAVELLTEGKSSAQAARLMGVKAQTVRTYLQRAYKKVGVANGKELLACFDQGKGAKEDVVAAWRESSMRTAHGAQRARQGDVVAYGKLRRETLRDVGSHLRRLVDDRLSPRQRKVATFFGAACATLLFYGVCMPHRWQDLSWSSGRVLIVAISICALVAGLAGEFFNQDGRRRSRAALSRLPLWDSAAFDPGEACIDAHDEVDARNSRLSMDDSLGVRASRDSDTSIQLFVVFLAFGFVWQELWRSSSSPVFIPGCVLFMLIAVGLVAFTAWRMLNSLVAWTEVATSCLAALLGLAFQEYALMLAVCLVLVLGTVIDVVSKGLLPARVFFASAVGFAAGAACGFVWMDIVLDALAFKNTAVLGAFSTREGLRNVAAFASGAVMVASLAALALLCRSLATKHQAWRLFGGASNIPNAQESLRHFLRGLGLSDFQASVALLIAQGLTTREMSERLNYAPGTINNARAAAYELLGVHNKAQLVSALERQMSSLRNR